MKVFLLSIVSLLFTSLLTAQSPDSTTAIIKTASSTATQPPTSNVNVNVADTSNYRQIIKTDNTSREKIISSMEWFLVFSPVIVFIIVSLGIRTKLKGFSLADALQSDQEGKKIIPNPEYTTANLQALATNPAMAAVLTPTIEISDGHYAKSSSRYLALITSALTWTIALCLTCYFIYGYIKTGSPPELNKLTDVVLTLGIGVVPYVFNKVSDAAKNN